MEIIRDDGKTMSVDEHDMEGLIWIGLYHFGIEGAPDRLWNTGGLKEEQEPFTQEESEKLQVVRGWEADPEYYFPFVTAEEAKSERERLGNEKLSVVCHRIVRAPNLLPAL